MLHSEAALGRIFIAIAVLGFGVENIFFRRYIVARVAPWPDDPSVRFTVACATALVFIVSGAALLTKRHVRVTALAIAALIVGWSAARHLPVAVMGPAWSGDWTNVLKAGTLAAGAIGVAAADGSPIGAGLRSLRASAPYVTGAFLLLCGIQHFMYAEGVARLIPWFIPGPLFWTYVAGVLLIASGIAFWTPPVRASVAPLAALMIFCWVILLHVPRVFIVGRAEWMGVFEALGISGVCLVLARSVPAGTMSGAAAGEPAGVAIPSAR